MMGMVFGFFQIISWDNYRNAHIPLEKKPIKFASSKVEENQTTAKLELIAKMSYMARKRDMEDTLKTATPFGFYL